MKDVVVCYLFSHVLLSQVHLMHFLICNLLFLSTFPCFTYNSSPK
uniref:Uncharacterized protein n=1 Tax=Amphimedon queenslandica TaxID=400682 RepID=A0A1X7URQ2_AMPQE